MTVQELHEILIRTTSEIKQDLSDLKRNDIFHLEQKVDRNTRCIAVGAGILMALQVILHFI